MALTYALTKDGIVGSFPQEHGLKIVRARITVGAQADYVSGFALDAGKLGLHKVLWATGCLSLAAGTLKVFVPLWHEPTSKLRFIEQAAGAGAFDELDQADVTAADLLDVIVLGIG